MGLEKNFQADCFRSLQHWGLGQKMVQDATKCPKCFAVVYPHHKGWPDYHGEILINSKLYPVKIECKAGKERLSFSEIREDQREYLDWYDGLGAEFPSTSYIWLQLGTGAVNSKEMPRKVWLVTWSAWKKIEETIKTDHKCSYIPYSADVAKKYNMRVPIGAIEYLSKFEMEYVSADKRWCGKTGYWKDYFK